MTWWRKVDTGEQSISDNGWIKIKSIFRKINPDSLSAGEQAAADRGWIRIRSIWRKVDTGEYSIATIGDGSNGTDKWIQIYSYGYPSPKSDGPKFIFIEYPYTSKANSSETADRITGAAWQNSKIYITRGKWQEDPIYFEFTFQRSYNKGLTWTTVPLPGVNDIFVKQYSSYSDDDYEDKIPSASNSNWPQISISDVRSGVAYRVKVRAADRSSPSAEDLNNATYYFPSQSGISPRLKFNFVQYSDGYELNENQSLSDINNNKISLKWKYDTSLIPRLENTDSYKNQILYMETFDGQRVFGPVDVPVTNNAEQTYDLIYSDDVKNAGGDYIINIVTIANDGYWTEQSLEQHLLSNETLKEGSMVYTMPLKPINTEPPFVEQQYLNNRGSVISPGTVVLNKGTWTKVKEDTTYSYAMTIYNGNSVINSFSNTNGIFDMPSSYNGYIATFTVTATNSGSSVLQNRQTVSAKINYNIDLKPNVILTSPSGDYLTVNTNFQIKATIENYPKSINIQTTDGTSAGAKDGSNTYNNVNINISNNTSTYNYESPQLQYAVGGTKQITVTAQPGNSYSFKNIIVPINKITPGTVKISPTCNATNVTLGDYFDIVPENWIGDGDPTLILQYEYRLYFNGLLQDFNEQIPNKVGDLNERVGDTLRGEVRAYFYNPIDLSKSIFTDWISSPVYTILPAKASFTLSQLDDASSIGGGGGQQVT